MEKLWLTITRNRTFREKTWRKYRHKLPETEHLGKKTWRKYREQLPETVHLGKKHGENIAINYQKPYI